MLDYSVEQELVQFGEGSLTSLAPRLDVAARRRTLRMSARSSDCPAVLMDS
jgi:hypothetical protein